MRRHWTQAFLKAAPFFKNLMWQLTEIRGIGPHFTHFNHLAMKIRQMLRSHRIDAH